MRITRRAKAPYSQRRTIVIWVATGALSTVMHRVVWSVTSSEVIRLIFYVIAIAVMGTVLVNGFRAMLKANEEEIRQNPKPW